MKKLAPILLLSILLGACSRPPETTATDTLPWRDNLAAAATEARDNNRLLLLNFSGSDWCGWCKRLNAEVFPTPAFQQYAAEHLVPGGTAPGQAYFINDGDPINMFEFARPVIEACGRSWPKARIPAKPVHAVLTGWQRLHFKFGIMAPPLEPLAVERVSVNNYFSTAKAHRDLGYVPRYTTAEATAQCLPYYTQMFHDMERQQR